MSARAQREEDVLGLDVPVDDPLGVGGRQALADLAQHADHPIGIHGPGAQLVGQRVSAQQLHREQQAPVRELGKVDDLGDVLRAQATGRTRLLAKHPERLLVAAGFRAQHLERDTAIEVEVLGLVDHPHATISEPALDLVAGARDLLARNQVDLFLKLRLARERSRDPAGPGAA